MTFFVLFWSLEHAVTFMVLPLKSSYRLNIKKNAEDFFLIKAVCLFLEIINCEILDWGV